MAPTGFHTSRARVSLSGWHCSAWVASKKLDPCSSVHELGTPAAAVEYLQPPARGGVAGLWRMPSNCDYLETAIEALVSAGDLDAAAELLEELAVWSRTMDGPWPRAVRARCCGLLSS